MLPSRFPIAAALVLVLAACGGQAASNAPAASVSMKASVVACNGSPRKLTLAISTIPTTVTQSIPIVAKSLGAFAKRCIDADIVQFDGGASAAERAVVSEGKALGSVGVTLIARGVKLRQLFVLAVKLPHEYMVAEDVHSAADLKGRNLSALGGGKGSFHWLMSREVLRSAGLTVDDAHLIAGSTNSRLTWLVAGQLDGIALNPEDVPFAREQKAGLHVLAPMVEFLPLFDYGPIGASEDFIRRDPELLRDGLAAMIEASRAMYLERDKVLPIIEQATQRPRPAVEYAYDFMTRNCIWPVNTGIVRERVEFMAQYGVEAGDYEASDKPSFERTVDEKLAREALAAAGGPTTIGNCRD